MKKAIKNKARMLKRRMFNTALILIFSVIAISTYYTANFSKAKDIVEVNVNILNSLANDEKEEYIVNAQEGSDGDSFYVKLPEYINNKKVIKYSYYLGESTVAENNQQEEANTEQETPQEEITTEKQEEPNVQQDETPSDESNKAENIAEREQITENEVTTENNATEQQKEDQK